MKKNKPTPTQELKGILRSTKQFGKMSDSSLESISAAIKESGIIIPQAADDLNNPTPVKEAVKLSKFDIVVLTLTSNPNKWFLVFSGNKKRQDIGLYQMGACFEMVRRSENGKINHYARYTGGTMNKFGQNRMKVLAKKMAKLGAAAAKNEKIVIDNATPRTSTEAREEGKSAVSKTKHSRKSVAKKPSKVSLIHAGMYPLSKDEAKFLQFINSAPRVEHLLSSGVTNTDGWFSFRWKWQSRYGFDMSQISLRQEKQDDGTFNVYGKYTPNAANMMNPGLKELVYFLDGKKKKSTDAEEQNTFLS